jgi:hypothetical protein
VCICQFLNGLFRVCSWNLPVDNANLSSVSVPETCL